jgi:hypothetical protein
LDGFPTEKSIEGYEDSICDLEVVLERTDCISKLNVLFDEYGNGHSILYHRKNSNVDETVGYGDVQGYTA